jgi:lysophospholipid acyltransferase (LPLAT)-like uncharacterized protein
LNAPKTDNYPWYDLILLRIIPPLAALLIKLLMLSCRVAEIEGEEKEREAISRSGGGAVYAGWHQRMSYLFHHFGSSNATTMISQSRDGEYAARAARWLGIKSVRGSSTRRGLGALKELVQEIRDGAVGGMLADGPVGPARMAKIGSLVIARDAEVPLIGVVWGADRCWVLNSWDRYLIPKPFARVAILYTEPILIPKTAKGEELESYRKLFEERMNQGARWCDEQFGPERPWRKVKEEGMPEIGPL